MTKINFSLKQAYCDLFKTEGALNNFLSIIFVSFFIKIPLLGYFFTIWASGWWVLLAHNVINGIYPIIPKTNLNKKILISGFKASMIEIIYCIVLYLFISILSDFIKKTNPIENNQIYFLLILLIISPIAYIVMSSFDTIFAENLRFREGFNLIKLLKTFKYVWKEYILINVFGIMSIIVLISMFSVTSHGLFLLIGIISALIIIYLILYVYVHLNAQAYKYALSQMYNSRQFCEVLADSLDKENT